MASGQKPNLARRREMAALRERGLSLSEIGRRLGISKQCVHETLQLIRRPPVERSVPCAGCAAPIRSAGSLPNDAGLALCLPCLAAQPDAEFGVRLKSLRLVAGITKAELARHVGASRKQIDAYERGVNFPRTATGRRIAQAVGAALLGRGDLCEPRPCDQRGAASCG
jgi:transcriptional regulator with XRE-family HTH domain